MVRKHATKNEIRSALRKKKRAGGLPPEVCPNPRCQADLRDPGVPEEYKIFESMFTVAMEVAVDADRAVWMCPVCSTTFQPHARPSDLVG